MWVLTTVREIRKQNSKWLFGHMLPWMSTLLLLACIRVKHVMVTHLLRNVHCSKCPNGYMDPDTEALNMLEGIQA